MPPVKIANIAVADIDQHDGRRKFADHAKRLEFQRVPGRNSFREGESPQRLAVLGKL